MSDIENLLDTVTPKSDQLNADDLVSTTKTIRVTAVKRGATKEQPVDIEYSSMDGRPYKPCKSMRRVLISAWGEDGREWVGRSMTLYCDHEVKFGGVKVGGIRISHLSHIDKTIKVMLSVSRGKRTEISIDKLPAYPANEFSEKSPQWINAIKAGKIKLDEVIKKASNTGILTDEQIDLLKKEIGNNA